MSQLIRYGRHALAGFLPVPGSTTALSYRGKAGGFPLGPDATIAYRFTDGNLDDLVGSIPIIFTRSTPGWYFNFAGVLTEAAIDEERFDYNGSTPLGLLLEDERINLFLNNTAAVTQGVTTAADTYSISVIGSGTVTLSGTGTGVASEGSPVIVPCSAGTLTCTVSGSPTYVQVELGLMPSSMIVTAGTPVTRAQDLAGITDMSWINLSEGTFYVKSSTPFSGTQTSVLFEAGTATRLRHEYQVLTDRMRYTMGNPSTQADLFISNIWADGVSNKSASVYALNDFELFIDGARSGTGDQVGTIPTGFTLLNLGSNQGNVFSLGGHLQEFGYANVRKNNAFLANITA